MFITPVGQGGHGDRVAGLQDGLRLLLDRRALRIDDAGRHEIEQMLAAERQERRYSDGTARFVAAFQRQHGLDETGEVNEATAARLNEALREHGAVDARTDPQWIVRGQVTGLSGPVDGVTVSVYDRDLFFGRDDEADTGQLLGTASSGSLSGADGGWFEIRFLTSGFASEDIPSADGRIEPDLVFVLERDEGQCADVRIVRLPDGETLLEEKTVSADDLVLGIQPRQTETVRIELDGGPSSLSEYDRVWQAMIPLIAEAHAPGVTPERQGEIVTGAAERFDEDNHRDISFVARETGLPHDWVTAFANGCKLASRFDYSVWAAIFYGLARSAGLTDLRRLASATVAVLDAGIRKASAANIVELDDATRIDAVETIRRMAPGLVLAEPPLPDQASLGEILPLAIEEPERQAELVRLAGDHEGSTGDFWATLRDNDEFAEQVDSIRYVTALGSLTAANVPLMRALREEAPAAGSLPGLAFHLDDATVRRLAEDPAISPPADLPGEDDDERRRFYADATVGLLRNAHPTADVARIAGELAAEGQGLTAANPPVSVATAQFLGRVALQRDTFDLATSRLTDVADLLTGTPADKERTLAEAQRIQRLFRISTSGDNLAGLIRSDQGSAFTVTTAFSSAGFVRTFEATLGGAEQAELTYQRASAVSAANVMLALHGYQSARDTTSPAFSAGLTQPPSWAAFFGANDSCACGHCRSWLSPAAYFVDLLLFLDRRHLAGQANTPLDVLLSRRPDLAHLQLSCENTDTVLPYVDLVNEVLETYVAIGALDASAAHDVTDETAAQLLAQPHHVREQAYTKLAQALYPPTLPFDRWLELARGYLGQLGLTRHDLIAAFAGTYGTQAEEDARGRERLAERLRISAREHEILTGHDFAGNPVAIATHDLYGLTQAQLPAALSAVPALLVRTQLRFEELLALLRRGFVNPAQDVAGRLDAIFAEFGLTSRELRAFIDAGQVAGEELTEKLRQRGRTPAQLAERLDALAADFPPDVTAKLIVLFAPDGDECDPAGMLIQHLDATPLTEAELRRMAVFLRLWRKIGWTMPELDTALRVLGAGAAITPAIISALADVDRLVGITGSEVTTLLGLWSDGTSNTEQFLARLLGLRPDDVRVLVGLDGGDPLADPAATVAFAELAEFVDRSGFTVPQLRYLYGEEPPGPAALAPRDGELDDLVVQLRTELTTITVEHTPPSDSEDLTADQVAGKIGQLLETGQVRRADGTVLADDRVALAMAVVEGRQSGGPAPTEADLVLSRRELTDRYVSSGPVALAAGAAIFPEILPPLSPDASEEVREQREQVVRARSRTAMAAACALLRDLQGRALITLALARNLGGDAELLRALLEDRDLLLPRQPGERTAMETFLLLAQVPEPAGLAQSVRQEFARLHRIALLVGVPRLTLVELRYLVAHAADFAGFAVAPFGQAPYPEGFPAWRRLVDYVRLRDRVTPGTPRLVDVFAAAPSARVATLSAATGWDSSAVTDALTATGRTADHLVDERLVATISGVLRLGGDTGAAPNVLRGWAGQAPGEAQVRAIEGALRARFDESGWLEVARGVHDPVRERQRDALVAFVLTMPDIIGRGLRTPDQLFEHFLIDVGMSSAMATSRIKQAISSVQLFTQRCQLNLEPDARPDAIDSKEWEWRKAYRVWEANRKIFLFPENWAEPELRDDKSPFFTDLEAELTTSDVTTETVERALLTYLEKLDAVANLEIPGFCWERTDGTDVLHVFGRTRTGVPRTYYYRRCVAHREWTPWEQLDVDIQGVEKDTQEGESGVHLLPVVWRGRLYLFWLQFLRKVQKKNDPLVLRADGTPIPPADEYWEVKLAWSRYEQGRWTPKRLSADFHVVEKRTPRSTIIGPVQPTLADPSELSLRSRFRRGSLIVSLIRGDRDTELSARDSQEFEWTLADPFSEPRGWLQAPPPRPNTPRSLWGIESGNYLYLFGYLRRLNAGSVNFQRQISPFGLKLGSADRDIQRAAILNDSVGRNSVTIPAQDELDPIDSGVFFQNDHHGYLVYLSPAREFRPLVATQEISSSGLRLSDALRAGLPLAPQLDLIRSPELVVNPSPWQRASTALAPAIVERTAVSAGLRPQNVLSVAPVTRTMDVTQQALTVTRALSARLRPGSVGAAAAPTHVNELQFSQIVAIPEGVPTVNARFVTFFHPHVSTFVEKVRNQGITGLLSLESQQLVDVGEFSDVYRPVRSRILGEYPVHDVDFRSNGAYSGYNWELFFHVPLLVAVRLSQQQRFLDAHRWFHRIVDFTDSSPVDPADDSPGRRFWKVKPLRDAEPDRLEELLGNLTPGTVNSPEEQELVDQLEQLAAHPFQPHRIARLRTVAYQKFVVMKYLDNLIAWGDQLFRRDTIETINEATQYYVLAAKLLGQRPERVPARRPSAPATFAELRPLLDEAGNAMAEMEHRLPITSAVAAPGAGNGISILLSMGSGLYFCIPDNDKLRGYWDVVEDRLFKIRHSMNIEGIERQLPLFEPPIDPALLVRAAAAGVDLDSVLTDLATPLPRYRFDVMLGKAREVCDEVRGFGAALLSALEKKDGEALSSMRAEHEAALTTAVSEVKAWQVAEAKAAIAALSAQRDIARHRLEHFSRMRGTASPLVPAEPKAPSGPDSEPTVTPTEVTDPQGTGRFVLTDGGKVTVGVGPAAAVGAGAVLGGGAGAAAGGLLAGIEIDVASLDSGTKMLTFERQELVESALASVHTLAGAGAEAFAGVMALLPQIEISAKPVGVGAAAYFGGQNLAAVSTAAGRILSAIGSWHAFRSSVAQKLAGFVWREQEHVYQCTSAALEIAQLDRQLIAAQIRLALAEKEKANHDLQVQQAVAVHEFLTTKYTDQELYGFLERETGQLFFRAYQLAYDLAKQAERCHRFELGVAESNYVQFGYWDSLRKGLLSGERLGLALRQLERAHLEQNRREYEVTRHVSLAQLDPRQLIELRETGRCEFTLPESLFDLDFPGQYFRRVKTVSVSVPCVVGPYTSVNGTLTQLSNVIRVRPTAQGDYEERTDGEDPRFVRDHVPMQSIATSGAQNDSGMFELNFRDERYLPFEGAGAVSRWRFELPAQLRQFDYDTMSDVVLHLRYTARDGGSPLRKKAVEALTRKFGGEQTGLVRMLSVRSEYPNEWQRYLTASPGGAITLAMPKDRFPYFAARGEITVTRLSLLALGDPPENGPANVTFRKYPSGTVIDTVELTASAQPDGIRSYGHTDPLAVEVHAPAGEDLYDEWQIAMPPPQTGRPAPTDLVLLCAYKLRFPPGL